MNLLEIDDLHVEFATRHGVARALNGVELRVAQGAFVGLVGETGAGKSLTALAALGMLRAPGRVTRGSIRFAGRDLTALGEAALRRIRGGEIAMIVQSPKTSLDPLARIGAQIARIHRAHTGADRRAAQERAVAMLGAVGIPDPERRAQAWPHQLSGGMAQRVLIAAALVNEPRLLIADEPTTGLDVTVQAQILDLLRDAGHRRGLATLMITHDLGIVAQYCDQLAVMYAGRVVEHGAVRSVFASPAHPYTQALLASAPDRARLGAIPRAGDPPNLVALPPGCLYAPRCGLARPVCATMPRMCDVAPEHAAACHVNAPC